MPATQNVEVTVQTETTGVVRAGIGSVALPGALDPANDSKAEQLKKFRRVSDAEDFYPNNQDMVDGISAVLGSGQDFVFAIGADGTQTTETISTTSTSITVSNTPITVVNDIQIDGSSISGSITYTTKDPSTLSVASGDAVVNTKTGDIELGDAPTTDATVDYDYHDWDAAFNRLNLEQYEFLALPGRELTAQMFGIFDRFLTEAVNENKVVAAGLPSGIAPTGTAAGDEDTIKTVVQALQSDRLTVLAAFYTGDLGAAHAATVGLEPPNGFMKRQPAPLSPDYTDTYTIADYGEEISPATDTFHEYGVNAVFEDPGGVFRYSSGLAAQGTTAFGRYIDVRRTIRAVSDRISSRLTALIQESSTSAPLTNGGIETVVDVIAAAVNDAARDGLVERVDPDAIVHPVLDDLSDTEIQNREIPDIEVPIDLITHTAVVRLNLNVSL